MRVSVSTVKMPSSFSTMTTTLFAPPKLPAYSLCTFMNGCVCGSRSPKVVTNPPS